MDKLLLLDDQDDVRYSFKRIFASPDLDLETAASGEEGLETLFSLFSKTIPTPFLSGSFLYFSNIWLTFKKFYGVV